MARIFAAYKRGVPFIKEQVDAVARHPRRQARRPGRLPVHARAAPPSARSRRIYIANLMVEWVNELAEAIKGGDSEYFREPARLTGEGTGFWEAPRGALYHSREGGRRQDRGLPDHHPVHVEPGSASTATASTARSSRRLIGVPVADIEKPINALRTVHSFDPCTACAVHVTERGTGKHFETVTSPWGVK